MRNVRMTGCTVPIRNQDLGWVVQAAQAAMAVRKMIPPDIKKKLDQLSVGHHVMKLFKSKTPKASAVWKEYVPVAGQVLGSDIDPVMFEEAFKGMWDTGQSDLGGVVQKYRGVRAPIEQFKADILDVLAAAVVDGRIAGTVTAASVYNSVVLPWLKTLNVSPVWSQSSGWGGSGLGHPRYELLVALVDRMLHDQRTGRNDLEHYRKENAPYLNIPTLTERAAQLAGGPPTSTPSGSPAPSGAPPMTAQICIPGVTTPGAYGYCPTNAPTPIPAPAPLPPGAVSIGDIQEAVRGIVTSIQATPAANSMTQQQIADAAASTAFQWLKSQSVPTTNPAVQQAVAAGVAGADWKKWLVPAGLATAAGLTLYLVFRRRPRRVIVTRSARA